MTYIHALTYMSHREMYYSNVHKSRPLQPIHNELEAKIVNLCPGLDLKAHYHESNPLQPILIELEGKIAISNKKMPYILVMNFSKNKKLQVTTKVIQNELKAKISNLVKKMP